MRRFIMASSFFIRTKSPCLSAFVSMILVTLFYAYPVSAQTLLPIPDTDHRSFIVCVNIAGILDETDSKTALAKMTAEGKHIAMKRIGLHFSKVKETAPQLDFELVKTPKGFLTVLRKEEVPNHSTEKGSFLWMETESRFSVKCRKNGERPETSTFDKAGLFDARIWTDKKEYEEGQKIVLYVQGNKEFYGKVVKIDTTGHIHQILPNNYRLISSFEKGKRYVIPDEADRYEILVEPPFGTIRFVVYAAPLPMHQVNLKTTAGGILQYRGSEESFHSSVKHIVPVGEEQIAELYDAVWEVKTVPHK
jgi:hypothetical protein